MKAVTRESRVVCLEVQAVLPGEVVALQESHDRRGVVVVLMFRRLLRLWLDEQRSLEADAVLVLRDHCQEARERSEERRVGKEWRPGWSLARSNRTAAGRR